MTTVEAAILGVVEGLTEFLPVSSTGHLILASELLNIPQTDAHKVFEVAIQLGAILAVAVLYRKKLMERLDLLPKLAVGFIPTGTFGFVLYKMVKGLFTSSVVSISLIVGGIVFLVVERFLRDKKPVFSEVADISYGTAFLVGFFQCLSMIPGVSRSGATIVGGLLSGMDRKTAAEFSFLLALPTMLAATSYDIYKNLEAFQGTEWGSLAVGMVVSFFFSIVGIRVLIGFVSSHTFVPFGIYRIVVGALFLLML